MPDSHKVQAAASGYLIYYADEGAWLSGALRTISRTSQFSSDRTIREYSKEIWGVTPIVQPK